MKKATINDPRKDQLPHLWTTLCTTRPRNTAYLHHSLATRLMTLYEIPGLNITEKPYISHISDATSFDKAVSCSPQISAFLKLHSHQIDNYFSGNHISECIFWAIKSRKMIENSWRQELVSSGEKPFMSLQRLEPYFHTSIFEVFVLKLWEQMNLCYDQSAEISVN